MSDSSLAQTIIVMSPAELAKIVRAVVREELGAANSNESEWLDRDGVATLTGYAPSYISELVRRRGLPCVRIGRKMRFRRAEVERWAKERGNGN